MQNKKILGIITARGGSKRVPRKNIKDFLGKPLLAWSIEVGQKSEVFDRFILSTDDKEIAKIGKKYGIEVPFRRPQKYAADTSSSYDAIKHAVDWLKEHENYETDWIILLEPSAPGRQPFHLREVLELIQQDGHFDSIVGISKIPAHFSHLKELQRSEAGIVTRVGDNEILRNLTHRNQDIPLSFYIINSAIYAFKTANLFDGYNSLWGDSTYGYVMEEKYALDINTSDDWIIAETKMKQLIKNKAI